MHYSHRALYSVLVPRVDLEQALRNDVAVGREDDLVGEAAGDVEWIIELGTRGNAVEAHIHDANDRLAIHLEILKERKAGEPEKGLHVVQVARGGNVRIGRRVSEEANLNRVATELIELQTINAVGRGDQARPRAIEGGSGKAPMFCMSKRASSAN